MAIYNAQNGTFSGKIGGICGQSWRGQNVIRANPIRRKEPTTRQREHQKKFRNLITIANALCSEWLPLVYKPDGEMTYANMFMNRNSDYFKNGVDGWTMDLGGLVPIPVDEVSTVEMDNESLNYTFNGFDTIDNSEVEKYLFGIHFIDENKLFFKIFNSVPCFVHFDFGENMQGETFYTFEQAILPEGATTVRKPLSSTWGTLIY